MPITSFNIWTNILYFIISPFKLYINNNLPKADIINQIPIKSEISLIVTDDVVISIIPSNIFKIPLNILQELLG